MVRIEICLHLGPNKSTLGRQRSSKGIPRCHSGNFFTVFCVFFELFWWGPWGVMLLLLLDFDVKFELSIIDCCGIIVALLWHYPGILAGLLWDYTMELWCEYCASAVGCFCACACLAVWLSGICVGLLWDCCGVDVEFYYSVAQMLFWRSNKSEASKSTHTHEYWNTLAIVLISLSSFQDIRQHVF